MRCKHIVRLEIAPLGASYKQHAEGMAPPELTRRLDGLLAEYSRAPLAECCAPVDADVHRNAIMKMIDELDAHEPRPEGLARATLN